MKFGKVFSKFITKFPEFTNLSANRCSLLTYKELRAIAKALYPEHKDVLNRYFFKTKRDLANAVYVAMNNM